MKIICVGKVKEQYLKDGIAYYKKQIQKKYPVEIIEVLDEMTPDGASEKVENKIKAIEGERILKYIRDNDYVIPLCIEGKQMDSRQFLNTCTSILREKQQELVFVIGGSLGLDSSVVLRGQLKLSFSAMTLPHQLMRMVLLEQLSKIDS